MLQIFILAAVVGFFLAIRVVLGSRDGFEKNLKMLRL